MHVLTSRPKFAPLFAVLGMLLVILLGFSASALAANASTGKSQTFSKNRVWENFSSASKKHPAKPAATQQPQWKNSHERQNCTLGILFTKDEDPTGLLNEGHRYRDLETGEFISKDPMGFIDGPNVYTYVRQNPWSGFDPEGLYEKDGGVTNNLLEASKAIQMNPSRSFGDSMKAMGLGIAGAVAIVPEAMSFSFKGAEKGLAQAKAQVSNDVASGKTNPVVGGIANAGIEVFGEGSLMLTGAALFRPVHDAIANPTGENVFNAAASLIIVKGVGPEGQSARGVSMAAEAEVGSLKMGDYSGVPDHTSVGPGKSFTQTKKKQILEQNQQQNGGTLRSDQSGTELVPAQQNKKGVTPPANEAHIDHIEAKSKGGTNSSSNAQVLSREENLRKSNK